MLSQGAIIERAMKAQRKQIEMLQQQLELKESEYQSAIAKVNLATKVAQDLQQQNKQLIEALTRISELDLSNDYDGTRQSLIDAVVIADNVLAKIEGKDDER